MVMNPIYRNYDTMLYYFPIQVIIPYVDRNMILYIILSIGKE